MSTMSGSTRDELHQAAGLMLDRINAAMAASTPAARFELLDAIWNDCRNTGLNERRLMVECMMARLAGVTA